jgi:threonine/homoserine/homoserine lactone efflux protein
MTDPLAFLGVALVVIVTPGQDTALTIRNTLLGGRRGGVLTACGVVTGQLAWALAASVGLTALLVAWQPGFQALKIAGAVYLIYLGLKALRDALTRRTPTHHEPATSRRLPAYRQGVLSNLGNPKMAVFFTSLLPQFAGANPTLVDLLLPGVLFAGMTLAWLSCYAAAVAAAGDFLRRPAIKRTLDGLTGAALVGLGLRVATDHAR